METLQATTDAQRDLVGDTLQRNRAALGRSALAKAALAEMDPVHQAFGLALKNRSMAAIEAKASFLAVAEARRVFKRAMRAVADRLVDPETGVRDAARCESVLGRKGQLSSFTSNPKSDVANEASWISERARVAGIDAMLCDALQAAAAGLLQALAEHEAKIALVSKHVTELRTARVAWDRTFQSVRFHLRRELSPTELENVRPPRGTVVQKRSTTSQPSETEATAPANEVVQPAPAAPDVKKDAG